MEQTLYLNPAISSTTPKSFKVKLYKLFHFFFGPMMRLMLKKYFDKIEVVGKEHLKGEPKLVLMNHSCPLDPLIITFFGETPLQFFITETFMMGGMSAKLAALFGQIAKRKLDFDPTSIRLMKQWAQAGANVALFPEGQFSFDGTKGELMSGLDQLIKYLDLPVVTVRLVGAEKIKPSWAKFYRKTSVRLEIDPPIKFNKADDSQTYIENKLFYKYGLILSPIRGHNLSAGLSEFLRFCPLCEADNTLKDEQNFLHCHSCHEKLEVTPHGELRGKVNFTITELLEKQKAYATQFKTFESLGAVELYDITKKNWQKISEGKLKWDDSGFKLGEYQIKIEDMVAHTLEWGNIIIIKTKRQRYALRFLLEGRPIWCYRLDLFLEGKC